MSKNFFTSPLKTLKVTEFLAAEGTVTKDIEYSGNTVFKGASFQR